MKFFFFLFFPFLSLPLKSTCSYNAEWPNKTNEVTRVGGYSCFIMMSEMDNLKLSQIQVRRVFQKSGNVSQEWKQLSLIYIKCWKANLILLWYKNLLLFPEFVVILTFFFKVLLSTEFSFLKSLLIGCWPKEWSAIVLL